MMPNVSIILTSYNQGKFIEEAINSVLAQSYKNWELLIVDDGSTDNTLLIIDKYIKQYPDSIKLYTHSSKAHEGICKTYELAFSLAKSEYIAFLEADDLWLKTSLLQKIDKMEKNKKILLLYTDAKLFGNYFLLPKKLILHYKFRSKIKNKLFTASSILLQNNIIPTFSTVILRNSFSKLSFNPPQATWLDWWLWYQLSLQGDFFFLPKTLTRWRIHAHSANNQFFHETKHKADIVLEFKNKLKELIQ